MLRTTVVLVHGFISDPSCWDSFFERLEDDDDLVGQGYRFTRFRYPTKFLEWNPSKRIPAIDECGKGLGDFLDKLPEYDQLFLVGHSMGGLVIQSLLAQTIQDQRGGDLAKIRSVILFATPNLGSTILSGLRDIFSLFRKDPQEEDLKVLDKDVAKISAVISRNVLGAKSADANDCPIQFRVFWGLQDDVVPEVSARGSFVEASPLPGDTKRLFDVVQMIPTIRDSKPSRTLSLIP